MSCVGGGRHGKALVLQNIRMGAFAHVSNIYVYSALATRTALNTTHVKVHTGGETSSSRNANAVFAHQKVVLQISSCKCDISLQFVRGPRKNKRHVNCVLAAMHDCKQGAVLFVRWQLQELGSWQQNPGFTSPTAQLNTFTLK